MKMFSERNPTVIAALGIALVGAVVIGALEYDKLPFLTAKKTYSAYFADSSGLLTGAAVDVSGLRVGQVSSLDLDGDKVLIKFTVDRSVRLGDHAEAAIKTKSLLGAKIMELTPRGEGQLTGTIPLDRTRSAYQLPDALGDLSTTINNLNTTQVSDSLETLAQTFRDSPPDLKIALQGVTRLSQTLNSRDEQLRGLLANANKATAVLAKRTDDVVRLIADTNTLLLALRTQSDGLDTISNNIAAVTTELKGFVDENRSQFKPALEKLNGVLTIVDDRKAKVQESIVKLNRYAMSLGESVSSGPFYKAYLANLLPGQFVQPFIDAAFSDLGLDPSVLLPSELTDPPVGQRATPALPVPYPRTGQGGEPHLTLPETITGTPGGQVCGSPSLPFSGTGCYPYREPLPAPPPGGPPPGPPAPAPPGMESQQTGPTPFIVHAPGEPVPADGGGQ